MNEVKTFLRGLPAFERFNERQIEALIGQLVVEQHAAGTELIRRGEQGRAMFIVMQGVIGVTPFDAEDAGSELLEMHAGEVVGRLSLLPDMPAPVDCRALVDSTVLALTREHFNALALLAPAIAHQFQYMIAVRLAHYLQSRNRTLRQHLEQRAPRSLLERLFGA